jgi:hypothetical protein
VKDLNRRKKTNYNNKTLAFRSKPTKPQFKALTAIKPEAISLDHKCCSPMHTTKSACENPSYRRHKKYFKTLNRNIPAQKNYLYD